MFADLRYAVRTLWKSPRFSLAAVLALALGMGATSAIFTIFYGVLLRPLPFPRADRLVFIPESVEKVKGLTPTAPATFLDWRSQQHVFRSIAAAELWGATLTGGGRPEEVSGLRVSPALLSVIDVSPAIGRGFDETDERAVLLSHSLWERRFGGDPGVVGRDVDLSGSTYRVIGVMPAGFHFPPFWAEKAELWIPLLFPPQKLHDRGGRSLRVFARLRDGVTMGQAQAEMNAISSRLDRAYPDWYTPESRARVLPLREVTVSNVRQGLIVLFAAVMFLLLIACANVANLLLARGSGRHKELALRMAIGAPRWRLIRQLLAESVTLSTAGGVLGLALAWTAVHALGASIPEASRFTLPRYRELGLDAMSILFTFGAVAATGILFGLSPALRFSRPDLHDTLKESGRGFSFRSRTPLRSMLAIGEIAVSLMLLAGAGLMMRSLVRLSAADAGFDPRNVLTMRVVLTGPAYAAPESRDRFYRRLLDQVSTLPGVESASAINHLPLAGDLWTFSFTVEGRPAPALADVPGAAFRVAMPGYFRTMRVPLLRGRDIEDRDDAAAPRVIVINETMARRFWPGEDAIGKRIHLDGPQSTSPWRTVVGVVKDVDQHDWATAPGNEFYFPYLQNPEDIQHYTTVVARTFGDPAPLASTIQKTVWSLDRDAPVEDIATMQQVVDRAVWQPRASATLLSVFAALALALAAVGVYGVISYDVGQRRREFGIRMALGARPSEVTNAILREGATLAVAGTAFGLAGALALTRYLQALLFEVKANDPAVLTAAAAILTSIALAAAWLPARRATRIDPIAALRE